MSFVTTHVLDTALGRPAVGIPVQLQTAEGSTLGAGVTNADGRIPELGPDALESGPYRLLFETEAYLDATAGGGFFPRVVIEFLVDASEKHYHVPVLLSPGGYTTYRGS